MPTKVPRQFFMGSLNWEKVIEIHERPVVFVSYMELDLSPLEKFDDRIYFGINFSHDDLCFFQAQSSNPEILKGFISSIKEKLKTKTKAIQFCCASTERIDSVIRRVLKGEDFKILHFGYFDRFHEEMPRYLAIDLDSDTHLDEYICSLQDKDPLSTIKPENFETFAAEAEKELVEPTLFQSTCSLHKRKTKNSQV